MKRNSYVVIRVLFMLGSLSFAAALVHADGLGAHRYGCHVVTVNERQGFVVVRTDTKQEALVLAARAQDVITLDNIREPVKEIVECIEYPGTFTSSSFQQFVDGLPR